MEVIKPLLEKIKAMAEEVGIGRLNGLDSNYYEREIVDKVIAGDQISITEAVDVVTFLRSIIQEDRDEQG